MNRAQWHQFSLDRFSDIEDEIEHARSLDRNGFASEADTIMTTVMGHLLQLATSAEAGRTVDFLNRDRDPAAPPRVGDKVLYVPPGEPDATSPAWARRAVPGRESVVVREPNDDDPGHYALLRWKHEDEPSLGGDDFYFAPAHRLRVVECAVYQPVQT